jgi:hypothetical protein
MPTQCMPNHEFYGVDGNNNGAGVGRGADGDGQTAGNEPAFLRSFAHSPIQRRPLLRLTLSLLKTRFVRIDGVARQESDIQPCLCRRPVSVENVSRLAGDRGACAEAFALIQNGTPVPADARLEVLGRFPDPESLFPLGQQNRAFSTFAISYGPAVRGHGPGIACSSFLRTASIDFRA